MAAFGRVFLAGLAGATVLSALVAGDAARAFDGAEKATASTVAVKPLEIFKNPRQALQSALESYNAGNPASVDALKYAAAGGESLARWKLGRMYADGDGVPRDDYKAYRYFLEIVDTYDEDTANWREKSVVASAFVAVGLFNLKGIPGDKLQADPEEALRLFLYAATRFSDSNAQYQLARLYHDGAPGVPKNHMQAARWLNLAAEKNHVESQALLGQMLFTGDGVPAQRARGLMWMALAREGAAGKTQDWIQAQYEKAIGAANDNDRQAALVYLEDHVKRRY